MEEYLAHSGTETLLSSRPKTFIKADSLSQSAIWCNKWPIHSYEVVTRLPPAAVCVNVP